MFTFLATILLLIGCPYLRGYDESSFKLNPTDKLKNVAKLIDHINSIPDNTWQADLVFNPEMTVQSFIKSRLGLKDSGEIEIPEEETNLYRPSVGDDIDERNADVKNEDLPASYDARQKYPKCTTISSIKEQANCGSCWAVAAASTLSDRFCIQSEGKISVNLSANYFAACSKENYGCHGGFFETAYKFLEEDGLITGGDFESDEGCQPYEIRPCGRRDTYPCSVPQTVTPKCKGRRCTNEYHDKDEENRTYKASRSFQLPKNETEIRKEIYKNGPVTAGFKVYLDFAFYKKGIYKKQTFWLLGRHAVKIIGWGEENGVKYWLVANSWSSRWAENGTFRIVRGTNDCLFEESVWATTPLI